MVPVRGRGGVFGAARGYTTHVLDAAAGGSGPTVPVPAQPAPAVLLAGSDPAKHVVGAGLRVPVEALDMYISPGQARPLQGRMSGFSTGPRPYRPAGRGVRRLYTVPWESYPSCAIIRAHLLPRQWIGTQRARTVPCLSRHREAARALQPLASRSRS